MWPNPQFGHGFSTSKIWNLKSLDLYVVNDYLKTIYNSVTVVSVVVSIIYLAKLFDICIEDLSNIKLQRPIFHL